MSEQSAWMCPGLGSIWPEDGIHLTTFRFAVQVHPITLMQHVSIWLWNGLTVQQLHCMTRWDGK